MTSTKVVVCPETPPGCSKQEPFRLAVLVGLDASIRLAITRITSMFAMETVSGTLLARMAVRTNIMLITMEMLEPQESQQQPSHVELQAPNDWMPPLPAEPPPPPPPPPDSVDAMLPSGPLADPEEPGSTASA